MGKAQRPGDDRLLQAFTACYRGLIRSLMKMCARPEDVDDILQETYLRVLTIHRKQSIAFPQNYLFVVSRNLMIEKLKRQSQEIVMEINDALLGPDKFSTDLALHYRQQFERLNEALRSLPEKKRRAILMRKYYGLSYAEIARKMKVSVASVEKYIASGIKECKRQLNTDGLVFDGLEKKQRKNPYGSTDGG